MVWLQQVRVLVDNPQIGLGAAAATFVVLSPVAHRFLWRQTFGRLRSESAWIVSSEESINKMKEKIAEFSKANTALAEQAKAAQQELQTAYSKQGTIKGQLNGTASAIAQEEARAVQLMDELRSAGR